MRLGSVHNSNYLNWNYLYFLFLFSCLSLLCLLYCQNSHVMDLIEFIHGLFIYTEYPLFQGLSHILPHCLYSSLSLTPWWGPHIAIFILACDIVVAPSQCLHCRLSSFADDVTGC